MATAVAPEARAARRSPTTKTATSSNPPTPSGWDRPLMPNKLLSAYRPAKEPTMNTSEWAKFRS